MEESEKKMSLFGKIMKYIAYVVVFGTCTLLILRVCMFDARTVYNDLVVDDTVIAAYQADPDNFEVKTHDIADIIADDGSFFAYGLYYIPSAQRMQITIKYNDSTVEAIFGTDKIEAGQEFSFVLYDGTSYIMPSSSDFVDRGMYRYCLLVFDNISLENADKYEIYMYATAISNYPPEAPAASLPCHYSDQPWEEYKLKNRDLKQLKAG